MQDIKIDLVYLWVDGNNKEWQEKRDFWAEKLGLKEEISLDRCRYVDNQELKYSLRSVEMYAPWINKIFIITDGQVPSWLDVSHPKIGIVNHTDIIPKEYLPTFNSEAIETCIANIPDLSEYFLYANDDMFFASAIKQNYFFDKNGNPYVDIKKQSWSKDEINKSLYKSSYIYTVSLLKKTLLNVVNNYENFCSCHCIDAYRKSHFIECKEYFSEDFLHTMKKKFRVPSSVQRSIVGYYMVEKKNAIFRDNTIKKGHKSYSQVNNLYLPLADYETMFKHITEKTPKLLCINDTNSVLEDNRINLKLLLEKLFPEKPTWEHEFYDKNNIVKKNYHINFSFNNSSVNFFIKNQKKIFKNKKFNVLNIINDNISSRNKKLLLENFPSNVDIRFININKLACKTPHFEEMKLMKCITDLEPEEQVILWGASLFLENFINKYQINLKNIVGIIDINQSRQGQKIGRYKIFPPEKIKNLNAKKIIVTIINNSAICIDEIYKYLRSQNIGGIKIEKLG